MKKIAFLVIAAIVVSSCAFFAVSHADVVTQFADGLEEKDISTIMFSYHDDADLILVGAFGHETRYIGKEAIRVFHLDGFNYSAPEVSILDWYESSDGAIVTYKLLVVKGSVKKLHTLELSTDTFLWGIQHHRIENYTE